MGAVNGMAIAQAIGHLEDGNYETQLNNELVLVNITEGFLSKEQEWTEQLNIVAQEAYIATLESGSDPSKSAEAAQKNEEYNIESAKMQHEEGVHNRMLQGGKTSLSNSTSSMGNNYKMELPVDNLNTTMDHLVTNMLLGG